MRRRNKYHARKVETSDGKFDSVKEFRRWQFLRSLEEKGEIASLERQRAYILIPKQSINGKLVERPVQYVADFVYTKDGETIVEDTKGFRTADYIIKRKLMLHIHGIRIKEV